ncbi:MAG TPA: DUF1634 domain-containing protein [Gemmatimonadaceae bacterium]|nr:DUF1634 domain-containing protein [Gemmatimonadaceae bacterium]
MATRPEHGAPPAPTGAWSDERVEQLVGRLLQAGVLIAALVVVVGGVAVLVQHGGATPAFGEFLGTAPGLRSLLGIVRGALALDAPAIVQLGLVLLIATPVARVALTLVTFALQRDRLYVLITAIVLAVLAYGLLGGHA